MNIINADCLDALINIETDSLDSLITDPPAGISFMNKSWDTSKDFVSSMTEIYKECLRVLKPGAHGLVWAIPRTSHWTATALEQAGFEIRDVITHIFGSGFPKSLDVSKAIDKMYSAEREIIGKSQWSNRTPNGCIGVRGNEFPKDKNITAPATDEAKQWQGWGTALKPASEHWILVRKPLGEDTVAKNVLKHGTGGLNIDESRISAGTDHAKNCNRYGGKRPGFLNSEVLYSEAHSQGRFPANLVLSHNEDCELVGTKEVKPHNGSGRAGNGANGYRTTYVGGEKKCEGFTGSFVDENGKETVEAWQCTEGCAVAMLDEQSGELHTHGGNVKAGQHTSYSGYKSRPEQCISSEKGGASRFFYCAKASKRDKGIDNKHPTVKSTKLMEYLIRLITPPNGTVLDPFMGSGSTGVAAKRLGFEFIGIEREKEYFEIAQNRLPAI